MRFDLLERNQICFRVNKKISLVKKIRFVFYTKKETRFL